MKIKDSEITLSSSRTFQENTQVKTAYQMEWTTILNDKFQEQLNSANPLMAGMQSVSITRGLNSTDLFGNRSLMNEMITAIQRGESGNGLTQMNGLVQSLLELVIQKMISMELLIGEFTDFKYDFPMITKISWAVNWQVFV